jgi:phenylalanyl-tRNA synthetase beta chain
MVFSKNLLAQFLPDICKITDNQLIDACGAVGMELEKIYKHPKLDNNVVIGKLIAIKKHENADNLSICTVAINSSKTLTIVTGAPNLILNKNVVVALNGAKLHNNIIIKNRELRGIMSEGMMCSYQELTPHNHDFIAKNDVDTILMFDDGEIGDTNVQELLQLDDTIYDIAIPFSNRNDLNGVLAFLQEIAGYFNFKLTYPTLKKNTSVTPTIPIKINFDVANGGSFLKINNIKLKESD